MAFGPCLEAFEHFVFHREVDGFDESPDDGLAGAVGQALPHEETGLSPVGVRSELPTGTQESHDLQAVIWPFQRALVSRTPWSGRCRGWDQARSPQNVHDRPGSSDDR